MRTTSIAIAAVALTAGSLLAADRPKSKLPFLEDVNVLLVVLDTVGAHQVAFDPRADTSPHLADLAARGVAFSRAYSTSSWTQPAVASLLTSRMPSAHGVMRLFDALGDDQVTMPESLRERGFATAGVISHFLLGSKYGYGQGFEVLDESAVAGHEGITSEQVTARAVRRLDALAGKRFFLLVHYFDPHYVYNHHPTFDRTSSYGGPLKPAMPLWDLLDARPRLNAADIRYLAGLHAEEVAFTDHHLGRLLAGLRERGLDRRTLVIVVGDHGEEFMEHGWIGHTNSLSELLVRVPLVVALPGTVVPQVVDEPVSLLDVLPTLLDLSRTRPATRTTQGRSLRPVLEGRRDLPARPVLAEVSFGLQPGDAPKLAEKMAFKTTIVSGRLKVVHDLPTGRFQHFDLASDPGERTDLSPSRRRAFLDLQERLLAWEAQRSGAPAARVSPSEDERKALRSLGYLQ